MSVSFCFAQECWEPWVEGAYDVGAKVSYNRRNYVVINQVFWSNVPPPGNDYRWQDEGECDDGSFNGDILSIPDGEAVIPTWKNGATGAYTMICDDFGDLPFDDAYKPVWDLAREPQFSEIKLAFGAIAGKTSDADWDSAVIMVSQGHEIVNHSMYHTEPQSWQVHVPEAKEANVVINEKVYGRINTAGEYFAKGKKCEYFIFPYDNVGGYDVLDNAGLVGARGGLRGEFGVIMAGDFTYYNAPVWEGDNNSEQSPFRIPFIANPNTVINMKETIDNIIAKKGYLIREYHAVFDKEPLGWYPASKDDMRSHFEYLKQKIDANELVVYTPSEMIKHRKTALAFETDAVLIADEENWILKLTMKNGAEVTEKYRDEISVLVNLGVPVEKISVAYDGNPLNDNPDNSPRIKPKKMDTEGKIWSVSINPFKTGDNSALLIRDGEWFGQGVDIVCEEGDWSEWDTLKIATCTEKGNRERICGISGEKESEEIPMLSEEECNESAIFNSEKSDSRFGIRFAKNPAIARAEINIILPDNEKISSSKIMICDNLGNIVFTEVIDDNRPLVWDLKNQNGRFVSDGSYLIIASVKTKNGKSYHYSSKLGVNR